MSDLPQIKALLQARVHELVRELAPEGSRSGAYWIAKNPTRNDDHAGSFWIRLAGSGIGVWADEATGDGAAQCPNGQHKGDVLGLVQYAARLGGVRETLVWCRDWLQLGQMPEADRQRRAALVQHQQKEAEADDAEKLAKKRRRAKAVYLASRKRPFAGSPADVYLKTRGIDVPSLARMPGVLGWLPADDLAGKHFETGTSWPVMVAAMTGDKGEIFAVHRTFLKHDGSGKAPVEPARKIWPTFGGAAIRLWRGSSGMSVDEAAKHGLRETLALAEGVEDGLSLVLGVPELRIWCAGSLGNLSAIRLPECCDEVVICADNDWGKPQAQGQLDKAVAWFVGQGANVRVARSHVGKDVNDALRGTA